jgi:hypothetical protein
MALAQVFWKHHNCSPTGVKTSSLGFSHHTNAVLKLASGHLSTPSDAFVEVEHNTLPTYSMI